MPRPRSEHARRSVLAAMRRAIAEGAFESLSIEGLAADAGVAKQTIYRWWPNKAAILGEAMLDGEIPGNPPALAVTADLAADLHAWFDAVGSYQLREENLALARALIAVTAADPALGAALNERFAGPVLEWIVRRIDLARTAGEVRADADAAAIADQFLAMASYAALLGRPLGPERIESIVSGVLWGIAAR